MASKYGRDTATPPDTGRGLKTDRTDMSEMERVYNDIRSRELDTEEAFNLTEESLENEVGGVQKATRDRNTKNVPMSANSINLMTVEAIDDDEEAAEVKKNQEIRKALTSNENKLNNKIRVEQGKREDESAKKQVQFKDDEKTKNKKTTQAADVKLKLVNPKSESLDERAPIVDHFASPTGTLEEITTARSTTELVNNDGLDEEKKKKKKLKGKKKSSKKADKKKYEEEQEEERAHLKELRRMKRRLDKENAYQIQEKDEEVDESNYLILMIT